MKDLLLMIQIQRYVVLIICFFEFQKFEGKKEKKNERESVSSNSSLQTLVQRHYISERKLIRCQYVSPVESVCIYRYSCVRFAKFGCKFHTMATWRTSYLCFFGLSPVRISREHGFSKHDEERGTFQWKLKTIVCIGWKVFERVAFKSLLRFSWLKCPFDIRL